MSEQEFPSGMIRLYAVTEFAIGIHRTQNCLILGLRTEDPEGNREPQEFQCTLEVSQAIELGTVLQSHAQKLL